MFAFIIKQIIEQLRGLQYNADLASLNNTEDENVIKILAIADCEFYENKKTAVTGRSTILSSVKNLTKSALGRTNRIFLAVENRKEGDVYFLVLHKYDSDNEIEDDFQLNEASIDSGFRSKRGTSVLTYKTTKVTQQRDDENSFLFTPVSSGNGLLMKKQFNIKLIVDPANKYSESNLNQTHDYLRNLVKTSE